MNIRVEVGQRFDETYYENSGGQFRTAATVGADYSVLRGLVLTADLGVEQSAFL